MAAYTGASEATRADLAALMKLWAEPEAAAGSSGARMAPLATPPPPPAPLLQPAAGEAAPSFGNLSRGAWLSDFVPQPAVRPAPPKAVVAPAAPPASAAELRCLDASHDAACTKCRSAPTPEEEALWLLVGENGAKNGEKRLRRLLTRTSQWANAEARHTTALAVQDLARMDVLARVLRGEANCGDLRKTHLLALCRAWGYRCDIWSQRAEANNARRGDAAARAQTQQAVRLPRAAKRDSAELAPVLLALPAALPSPPPPRKKAKAAPPPAAAPRSNLHDSFLSLWGPMPPLMPTQGFAGADVPRLAMPPAPPMSYEAPEWTRQQQPVPPPQPPAAPARVVAVQPRSAAATLEMLPAVLRRAGVSPAAFSASLAPFATAYRQLTAGERSRAAAATHGAPFLDARILAELAVSRANLVAATRAFVQMAADVKALQLCDTAPSGLQPSGERPWAAPAQPPPAWMALDGRDMPGEALCKQLTAACGASARDTRARLAIADAAEDGDDARAAERVWLADSLRVQHTAMHAMTHATVLLRELQLGYADEFGPAAGALLDAAAVVCAAGVQGVDARSAWVSAYIKTSQEADAMLGFGDDLGPPAPLPWQASRLVISMPVPLACKPGQPA